MKKNTNRLIYISVTAAFFAGIFYPAVFAYASGLPSASTQSASVAQYSATLFGTVYSNGADTFVWFDYWSNPSGAFATGGSTVGGDSSSVSFSKITTTLYPNTTYYYRLSARNLNGTVNGETFSFTTPKSDLPGYNYGSGGSTGGGYSGSGGGSGVTMVGAGIPIMSFLSATYISSKSALINGTANPNGDSTIVWFEWGIDPANLSQTTISQPTGSGATALYYSYAINGLLPNTIYYVRTVGQNAYGTQKSSLGNFTTASVGVGGNTAVPMVPTTTKAPENKIVVAEKPNRSASYEITVSLNTSADNINPKPDEGVGLSVVYKNKGSEPVHNAVLHVNLPQGITYLNSPVSPRDRKDNNLTFYVGMVDAGAEGATQMNVKVDKGVSLENPLILNSSLDYKDIGERNHTVSSFLALGVAEPSGALAAIMGTFFGYWTLQLLLLFFALLIIFLIFLSVVKKKRNGVKKNGYNSAANLTPTHPTDIPLK